MEFLAPFWDRLFYRCDPATQYALLRVCTRVSAVGMTSARLGHRLRLYKRRWQEKCFPDQAPEKCLKEVKNNRLIHSLILPENLTPELCLALVQKDGFAIKFLPPEKQTRDICLAAIRDDYESIFYIHKDQQTEEVCLSAVTEFGATLRLIDVDKRTYEVCLAAISNDRRALEFVPTEFRSFEFFKQRDPMQLECHHTSKLSAYILDRQGSPFRHLRHDPSNLEMYRSLFECGHCLSTVPIRHRTPEICAEAIHQNRFAIKYVF